MKGFLQKIVDLIRNDLNLISEKGSVHVPALMKVESFSTVHQLVSTIQSQLRHDLSSVDAMMHCFPPGKFVNEISYTLTQSFVLKRLNDGSAETPIGPSFGVARKTPSRPLLWDAGLLFRHG